MRKDEIRKIVRKKYTAYRDQVVARIKELPPECCLSGDDSGLEDVWEEFKCQVQREESYAFDAYVSTIEALCEDVLGKLPDHELELLWIDCDGYFDHDEDDGPPDHGEMVEGVARELYQKVTELASDEELKFDPDEERQIEAFEDDLAPYRNPSDGHDD